MSTILHPSFGIAPLAALSRGPYGCPLVAVHGEIDFSNRDELAEQLRLAQDQFKPVVFLDLRGLKFIDSSGLHVIQRASRNARDHSSRLLVVRPRSDPIQRVFALAGVTQHLLWLETLPHG